MKIKMKSKIEKLSPPYVNLILGFSLYTAPSVCHMVATLDKRKKFKI